MFREPRAMSGFPTLLTYWPPENVPRVLDCVMKYGYPFWNWATVLTRQCPKAWDTTGVCERNLLPAPIGNASTADREKRCGILVIAVPHCARRSYTFCTG